MTFPQGNHKATVLLVDDEPAIRLSLAEILELESQYNVVVAASGEEALALAAETELDLVLLDIHMPGMNGLRVLDSLKRQYPLLVVIMLTGHSTVDSAVHAMRHGAAHYLQKPVTPSDILESVKDGLAEARRERQRNATLLKTRQLLEASLRQLDEATPEQTDLLAEAKSSGQALDPDRFLQKGPLVLDVYRRAATLDKQSLDLTAGEYDLLLCLVQHAPQVLDPQELVRQTRGFESTLHEARDLIRWQVYLLRQKVEVDPSSPKYILNVRGRGYMWAPA